MAPRLCTWFFPLIAALWALTATSGSLAGEHNGGTCVDCHAAERGGFNPAHAFAAANCVNCHAGDDTAPAENTSHRGSVPRRPGRRGAELWQLSCRQGRIRHKKPDAYRPRDR